MGAARLCDEALALEPRHSRALHNRAEVALERGEADALRRFDRALAVNPGDGNLWLGKAQALKAIGDLKGARIVAEQICTQAPGFIAALHFLTGLRLAAGEKDFAAPFRIAASKTPQDPNIAAGHADALAGLDLATEAAEVAARARERFPAEPHFALLEAVHAGTAGEWDRADAIFAELPANLPNRAQHEARHRIRAGDLDQTDRLLDLALAKEPWSVPAWALRGVVSRMKDDSRAHWLHQQTGLIQFRPLKGRGGLIEDALAASEKLHANAAMPLGQSLRGGSQTRGLLLNRCEPVFDELRAAIEATLEDYRCDLPAHDKTHPLLRHRKEAWRLAGSWSVRLAGGSDYHTSHIHPGGIISSALYLALPQIAGGAGEGALELGRPPKDLGTDLGPLCTIAPKAGHLALFPATLYHGTTPFASGERVTVAFDVVAAPLAQTERRRLTDRSESRSKLSKNPR